MTRFFGMLISIVLFVPLFGACYESRNLENVSLVSRKERGAEENWRYASNTWYQAIVSGQKNEEAYMTKLKETDFEKRKEIKDKRYQESKKSQTSDEYLETTFPNEFGIDKTVSREEGNQLRRPYTYHAKKQEIIIHHTADEAPGDFSVADEIAEMQRIYAFHAFTRGRWDIGYHFVIWPSGKIYEWRAGWPGVIGAHAKYNNTASIGISLMGNFSVQEPTSGQIESLITLTTALARKYNIDPFGIKTYHASLGIFPYIGDSENFAIAGHKDAGQTACPGEHVYEKLPHIRERVVQNIKGGNGVSLGDTVQSPEKPHQFSLTQRTAFQFIQERKRTYLKNHALLSSEKATLTGKMTTAPSQDTIPHLTAQPVRVLLKELSDFSERDIRCENCMVYLNSYPKGIRNFPLRLKKTANNLLLSFGKKVIPIKQASLEALSWSTITIENYRRSSYGGIPRNTFRGKLSITPDIIIVPDKKEIKTGFVMINELSLSDYLAGIVETNDQESREKNKVMAILAKNYVLFYADKGTAHPSIPLGSSYTAIDDPASFQKYVGAGAEKTLAKRRLALQATKNEFLLYDEKIAITPYFSCSYWFTRSAQEKRGRIDTPYLTSKIDFASCDDFEGHGVGMSGKGASVLAAKWFSYQDILGYYYPGTQLKNIAWEGE